MFFAGTVRQRTVHLHEFEKMCATERASSVVLPTTKKNIVEFGLFFSHRDAIIPSENVVQISTFVVPS